MDLALLALRLVVGLFFVGHGAQKLFGAFGGQGLSGTTRFFESIGIRPARRNAVAAGGAELVGGVLLALGLLVPLGALLVISVMTTAILAVHAKNGPWISDSGYEYNLVIIAVAFAIAAGPGGWSLDAQVGLESLHGTGAALIVLVLGVAAGVLTLVAGRSARWAGEEVPESARDADPRFERTPAEKRAATVAERERPGIPADPR